MASQIRHSSGIQTSGESIMKLLPLLDRTGNVKYWADPRSSWMTNLTSDTVAFIAVDAVYDKTGFSSGGGTATTLEIEMARWCCLFPAARSTV